MTRFSTGRASGLIFEVLMQVRVGLVRFLPADGSCFAVGGAEVCLLRRFRTDGAEGDELLQIFLLAGRAFRRRGRMQDKVFKAMSTLPAFVFKDWHKQQFIEVQAKTPTRSGARH